MCYLELYYAFFLWQEIVKIFDLSNMPLIPFNPRFFRSASASFSLLPFVVSFFWIWRRCLMMNFWWFSHGLISKVVSHVSNRRNVSRALPVSEFTHVRISYAIKCCHIFCIHLWKRPLRGYHFIFWQSNTTQFWSKMHATHTPMPFNSIQFHGMGLLMIRTTIPQIPIDNFHLILFGMFFSDSSEQHFNAECGRK